MSVDFIIYTIGYGTLRGAEDDSEGVETCRPKITFYVIKKLLYLLLHRAFPRITLIINQQMHLYKISH